MRATKDAWTTSPMPERRAQMSIERRYTVAEFDHLADGEIPASQDDRWFIWVEASADDGVVHVHRSWTGLEIYRVLLRLAGNVYEVAEAWVNDDSDQYQPDPGMDGAVLESLLDRLAGRSPY